MSAPLDPVTLAVLAGRLEQIADEMDATLFRAAFNPIIAEAHDASHGLYHAETGDTLVQGKTGLPIFVGVMAFAVKAVIARANALGGPREGDVWIFNDAHEGGTHLSDMRLVAPFFRDGRLFCWLASVGHWHDVGGAVPGNYNPGATDAFQEAFVLPPVRLLREGEMQQEVVDILLRNTRLPASARGDLEGQLGALELGARRLGELLDEHGEGTVSSALDALADRAEALMREALRALPDGRWEAEDFLDNDGISDEALPVRVALSIEGERMTLDFAGTAGAVAGPVNIARPTAVAACYVAVKHLFPDLPANAGVMRPVEVAVPDASLLDAAFPAPVGGYTETILRMIDVVFSAFAQAAPGRAVANAYGTINALSIAGRRSGTGQPWVMFSFYGGGHGGTPEGDGLSHGNAPISMATIPPLEILEAAYPVMFRRWALREGSAGEGRHRGGLGAIYEIELLEARAEAFFFGERAHHPPRGVAGGGDGALNRFAWETEDGWESPPLGSKMRGLRLARGQAVRLETPGGGGWGDPAQRDPQAVARDRALGLLG